MKNISSRAKKIVLLTAFNMLAVSIPFHTIYAAPGNAMEPAVATGITILPLDQPRFLMYLRTKQDWS